VYEISWNLLLSYLRTNKKNLTQFPCGASRIRPFYYYDKTTSPKFSLTSVMSRSWSAGSKTPTSMPCVSSTSTVADYTWFMHSHRLEQLMVCRLPKRQYQQAMCSRRVCNLQLPNHGHDGAMECSYRRPLDYMKDVRGMTGYGLSRVDGYINPSSTSCSLFFIPHHLLLFQKSTAPDG